MERGHIIALDTHCTFTVAARLTPTGELAGRRRVPTTIPALRELIEAVGRPRHVVLEEGPLADWLVRELRPCADAVIACDPRRNAHIAKDGDKDDPIDALKLAQLYRGGFVVAVHHPDTLARAGFKQLVGLYHDRVRNLVRQANRILAQFRRHGIFGSKADLLAADRRRALLDRMPLKVLRAGTQVVLDELDVAHAGVVCLQRLVRREARSYEPIRRFVAVPGVKWIRAATFFAYIDTPFRFPSKPALWRYMGIGLERRHSGAGPELVRVPASCTVCRPLKGMILGAAKSALVGANPFAARYQEWLHAGVTPRNARRNVARSQAATLWGLFKSGREYQPAWVGRSSLAVSEVLASPTDG
jgi:transposase